jgi:hypothetical protein
MGYIFDRNAHSLRPIHGIPGAAMFGDPVDSGFAIDQAATSSQLDYALAIADGRVRLIRFNPEISVSDLPVPGRATALYLSPQGTAAAVISDGWLGFVTGLNGSSPQIAGLAFDSRPINAAVSDDGAYLFAALPGGSATLFGSDGTRTPVPFPAPILRVAFRPGGTDALAASVDNRVWLDQQTVSAAVLTLIASADDGIADPVGMSFLPGGNRAVIANSGTGIIQSVDILSGARSSASCTCNPAQLEPMATPGVFRLTAAVEEPQYMFDGTSGQTFFVPAVPSKSTSDRRPRN